MCKDNAVQENTTKTAFKLGDKVRIVKSPYRESHQPGDIGTVTYMFDTDLMGVSTDQRRYALAMFDYELELVPAESAS